MGHDGGFNYFHYRPEVRNHTLKRKIVIADGSTDAIIHSGNASERTSLIQGAAALGYFVPYGGLATLDR